MSITSLFKEHLFHSAAAFQELIRLYVTRFLQAWKSLRQVLKGELFHHCDFCHITELFTISAQAAYYLKSITRRSYNRIAASSLCSIHG